MFEDGIATAAVWRDADALEALHTTGGGGNTLLNKVGAKY